MVCAILFLNKLIPIQAVAEGRAIYNNTKQFIRYMISSNIGEVVCIFVAAVLGIPDTLAPVQLLWVNLVTDGLPAIAIGFNRQDSDVMKSRPRKVWPDAWGDCLNGSLKESWRGTCIDMMNFDSCSTRETTYPCSIFDDRHPSTVSMTVLVVVEMFNALNNLSENQSLLVIPPWSNLWLVASIVLTMLLHILILYVPPLSILFSVTPLSWAEWEVVLYLSFPVIIIDEVLKFFSRNSNALKFFILKKLEHLPVSLKSSRKHKCHQPHASGRSLTGGNILLEYWGGGR
ncbi:unnamed protein product [Dovyalis caffra]|uniref:Cation-transporting P-type ATPase C-terminal domain-containing protein n=1 Tax=Dovyalis caffra TaxID=77055 RepID=A0AAV1SA69_9ROSI|nr:unnamed protein product [Dovyalis caffra]